MGVCYLLVRYNARIPRSASLRIGERLPVALFSTVVTANVPVRTEEKGPWYEQL